MLRRSRLLEMLDDEAWASFTVLNAAVGYGKTTLVRSWCIERPEAVIWITLDSADDDPVRLWAHLATAVERLGEGLGRRALSCLGVRGAPVGTAVDELMNGLVAYGRRVTIVLDDLHAVRSDTSVRSIAQAIEHLPTNARLVASTRSDPAIGLGRLRARRVLAEVRARELAFTVDETRELLVREGIGLSSDNVELLVDRTEGWPAGLYLAALWLRDHQDPNGRVREFAASARQVGEYLADEVLTALAPNVKDFLVRTSVLGRFTPELCDAVLSREDSFRVLSDLAHSNMFLVALDARGEWYRYHHLFGAVLQLELEREAARELRRRAAVWCGAHGLAEEAIEYAAAAGDPAMVAELLIERHLEFIWGGRLRQFLDWVRWLPPELLERHPVLPGAAAVTAALLAEPEVEIHRLLAVAERARVEQPQLWLPYLEVGVEAARSQIIEGGDVGAAVRHARRAVAAAREGADVLSVSALACLAQALFFAGELDETQRVAVQAVERPDAPNVPDGYVGTLGLLAVIDAEQRRPEGAEAWARQALSFARHHFQADSWVASMAHLGLALACADTGRLDEAEREALRGERLRRSPQPTVGHTHALLVLAQVRLARSRLSRSASDLEHAQRAIAEFPDPGRLPAMAATIEQTLVRARADAGHHEIVEEPSPAELAVLQGLAAGLSRREIGAELYISLNTVKTHTRELYRKLGATSQAEAVAHAEALGLLERNQSPG
jgi:LuxR family maltose regulon positive regulatory protein